VGGLISPSSGLIPVLADLVQTSPASSGHPLLLRAVLPGSHYMIAVPLPAHNYFLNVLATAPGPSLYLWFCLSAAAEFLVSRGLQPAPTSACLGQLTSYPDWEESDDLYNFLVDTGFITLGYYTRFISQWGMTTGVTRLQLGTTFYCDDVVWYHHARPLLMPMLVAISTLPSTSLQSSSLMSTAETEAYLELLQVLLLSIAAHMALPGPTSRED